MAIAILVAGVAPADDPKDQPPAEEPELKAREEFRRRIAFLKSVDRTTTAQQVKASLQEPRRVARQLLHRRHVEQWFYELSSPGEPPIAVRVELLWTSREEARVLTVYYNRPLP
jgi:hypothetical protein